MLKKLFKESLIVLCGTLFFLALCATVGISTSTPPTKAGGAKLAHEQNQPAEDLDNAPDASQEPASVMSPARTGY